VKKDEFVADDGYELPLRIRMSAPSGEVRYGKSYHHEKSSRNNASKMDRYADSCESLPIPKPFPWSSS
jgi:hypothetical protein